MSEAMATPRREKVDETTNYYKFLKYKTDESAYRPTTKLFLWHLNKKDHSYVDMEIKKDAGAEYVYDSPDGEIKIAKAKANMKNPVKFDGVEDCAVLSYLNEPAVLHNLKVRYAQDLFYTNSGLFLVAVNPYKRLPIYTEEMINTYRNKRRADIAPHVFAVSDEAYRNMIENRQNQSMLITGESGAGKTENTKKVIQYLAFIAGKSGGEGVLEDQLLKCNPILEAFGNAKTTRNDNSSRFGKFIEVQFNSAGYISGAIISAYLFEKSRVTEVGPNERSYHIFYQLIEAGKKDKRLNDMLHLDSADKFAYLSKSGCTSVAAINDLREFQDCVEGLNRYEVDTEDQDSLWKCVAAVMHLGNWTFVEEGKDHLAAIKDKGPVKTTAELLGVEPQVLEDAICRPRIKAGLEVVKTHLSKDKAADSRDALAMGLFHRLFLWLVKRINKTLSKEVKVSYIGVLDISGFEIFKHNSLEQLLINYTNERLQQFFNHHMFTLEQEEYAREKIDWTFIDFGIDSQEVIDLIEKKPIGILALLNEECHLGKVERGDGNFLQKLTSNFGKHKKYRAPKFNKEGFAIEHYAGLVEYTTGVWLDKNRDPLADDIAQCLKGSNQRFIERLFTPGQLPVVGVSAGKAGGRTKGAQFITVAAQHREQLHSLMATLQSTYPHFIRCIIPNDEKRTNHIIDEQVLEQLRCNGVLEGIRISRKGFPNRLIYPAVLRSSAQFAHACPCQIGDAF